MSRPLRALLIESESPGTAFLFPCSTLCDKVNRFNKIRMVAMGSYRDFAVEIALEAGTVPEG